jgi:hypothetical protein
MTRSPYCHRKDFNKSNDEKDLRSVREVNGALSYWCMRTSATSVCGLKPLVLEA